MVYKKYVWFYRRNRPSDVSAQVLCYDETNYAAPPASLLFLCNMRGRPGRAGWERAAGCKGVPELGNGGIRTVGRVLQASSFLCL